MNLIVSYSAPLISSFKITVIKLLRKELNNKIGCAICLVSEGAFGKAINICLFPNLRTSVGVEFLLCSCDSSRVGIEVRPFDLLIHSNSSVKIVVLESPLVLGFYLVPDSSL